MPQADIEAVGGIRIVAVDADLPAAADLCTIRDACFLLGVSRRTVYNWMVHGKLRWFETPGGTRRIVRADLLTRRRAVKGG